MKAFMPTFYTDLEVRERLKMPALIDAMAQVLKDVTLKNVQQPIRTVHEIDDQGSLLFLKPVFTKTLIATKAITQMPANAVKGLPSMMATLLLMDRQTGSLLGVMEATSLTNLRTAAVSAVAVRQFSEQKPLTVAIIGSGALARTHAQAIRCVREVKTLRIWSRSAANREACAKDLDATACESAEQACDGADVIVTVTLSAEPVVNARWVKTGAVVCAVGAPRPTWRELDTELMLGATVIADSRASAESESGDILISGAKVYAEIGEILLKVKTIEGKPTIVFKSLGLAAEDAGAAELILKS
jgi:ornithine cyclodeaminase/alanine dehydrogenase-like protein (mu-crystallin family)